MEGQQSQQMSAEVLQQLYQSDMQQQLSPEQQAQQAQQMQQMQMQWQLLQQRMQEMREAGEQETEDQEEGQQNEQYEAGQYQDSAANAYQQDPGNQGQMSQQEMEMQYQMQNEGQEEWQESDQYDEDMQDQMQQQMQQQMQKQMQQQMQQRMQQQMQQQMMQEQMMQEQMMQEQPQSQYQEPPRANQNPLTGANYTPRFYHLLEKRQRLPAWAARQEFLRLMQEHQAWSLVGRMHKARLFHAFAFVGTSGLVWEVLMLAGAPGSGKTTQLPQILLDAGYHVQDGQVRAICCALAALMGATAAGVGCTGCTLQVCSRTPWRPSAPPCASARS